MTVGFRSAIVLATLVSIELISGMRASADWEFTRWGMTPEQVISASQGRAIADPAPPQRLPNWVGVECKVGLTSYRINEYRFRVQFCFNLRNMPPYGLSVIEYKELVRGF
jgi:hypothetical protein